MQAAECKDDLQRFVKVVCFACSAYNSGTRTKKPFNPVLGETFQHYVDGRRVRLLAEQVSHHPPIGAVHAQSDAWKYEVSTGAEASLIPAGAPAHMGSWPRTRSQNWMQVKTKFGGNSIQVQPLARYRVTLSHSGEQFTWGQLT